MTTPEKPVSAIGDIRIERVSEAQMADPEFLARVAELADYDLPVGYPRPTSEDVAQAFAGSSEHDPLLWADLRGLCTMAAYWGQGADAPLAGIAAVAYRLTGEKLDYQTDEAVVVWSHTGEDPEATRALLTAATTTAVSIAAEAGVEIEAVCAYDFAGPTTPLEALPVKARPVTAQVLTELGFAAHTDWLLLAGPVRDGCGGPAPALPPGVSVNVSEANDEDDRGFEITLNDDESGHVIGEATAGLLGDEGMAEGRWLWVEAPYRHHGLGRTLLLMARERLVAMGAHTAYMHVDIDDHGERDRRPALSLYEQYGAHEVDTLCSFRLTLPAATSDSPR